MDELRIQADLFHERPDGYLRELGNEP